MMCRIVQSCDPNEISGPLGTGEGRYVLQGEWMNYTIYFENKTNATAAAQEITVTLPMDPGLDWSTLELGEIAFGEHIDMGLNGKRHGSTSYALPGTNTSVKTEVSTVGTNLVWYLRIYDPKTLDNFPDDPRGGFLPPNDPETHCGEGHLSYRVKVADATPNGTVIRASADIQFDTNEHIETDPSWWNTVGEIKGIAVMVDGVEMTLDLIVGLPYGELPGPGVAPAGHTFGGWYTAPGGPHGTGRKIEAVSLVEAGDGGLYQYWTPNAYVVKFDANGGTGKMEDQAFTYDVVQELKANSFTWKGYVFMGWASAKDMESAEYADCASVKNLTSAAGGCVMLYAIWEKAPSTTLYDEDDTFIDTSAGEVVPYSIAAAVYDGYVVQDGVVKGTVQVKVAKAKVKKAKKSKSKVEGEGEDGGISAAVTATVQLVGEKKKLSFKGGVADAAGTVSVMSAGGYELDVSLGVNGLGGELRRAGGGAPYQVDGARNVFSAKDAKALAKEIESMWVGAINVVGDDVVLAVSVAKKGKVKVSGTVNGAKVTATSQLLVGETACCVPVVVPKENLAFNLWLMDDGTVEIDGLEGAVVGKAGTLKSGAAFAFGDTAAKGLAALPGLLTEHLPDGLEVMQNKTKWVVAPDEKGKAAKAGKVMFDKKKGAIDEAKLGENPSALKLTYTAKTGSFKGSFKAYTLIDNKVKAYTFNITGVMIGDAAYGTATLKKPEISVPIVIE